MKIADLLSTLGLGICCLLLPSAFLAAAPFSAATVIETRNEVTLSRAGAERPAQIQDRVGGSDALKTGKKSRAELEFADHSLARLGANTIFSFDPNSRNMRVEQGTALVHVPPGLNGARISTPAATAAIQGDVVALRVNPEGGVQIVALSRDARGPVTITLNKTGETRTLEPGQLLTINPTDLHLPTPVNVSVDALMQSSGLAKGFSKGLPDTAKKEIDKTLALQNREIRNGAFEIPRQNLGVKNDFLTIGNLSSTQQTIVQNVINGGATGITGDAARGNYFAGNVPNSYPGTDAIALVINSNSSWSATINTITPFSCSVNFSGIINSDRSFSATANGGNSYINGTVASNNASISGNFKDGCSSTGAFNIPKQ